MAFQTLFLFANRRAPVLAVLKMNIPTYNTSKLMWTTYARQRVCTVIDSRFLEPHAGCDSVDPDRPHTPPHSKRSATLAMHHSAAPVYLTKSLVQNAG